MLAFAPARVRLVAGTNLIDQSFTAILLPLWVKSNGYGPETVGLVLSVFSVAAVLSSLAAAAWGHRLPRHLVYLVGFILGGVPRFIVLALGAPLWMVLAVCVVGGMGSGFINPICRRMRAMFGQSSKAIDQGETMSPPTTAERGREVREKLLASARELIGELGWNAVSTRILADRAGVRSGLVHYHFESLSELLRRAALETVDEILQEAAPLFTDVAITEAVEAMLSSLDQYTGVDPVSLVINETYLAATRDERLRTELAERVRQLHEYIAGALRRHGHPDPDGATWVLMTVLDGFVLHKALNADLSASVLVPTVRSIVVAER